MGFLEDVIDAVGFKRDMITVILNTIKSMRLSVIWNGEQLPSFTSGRGLRQGDSLSPYLFVLCMEVLGHQIKAAVREGRWKTCKASQYGPELSHLFFADDLLFF